MELTGLQITIQGGRKKFVGKVGPCPYYPDVQVLTGKIVLYRESPYRDCIARVGNAFSIDRAVCDTALGMGAQYLVNWCDDTNQLLIVPDTVLLSKHTFVKELDRAERPQYRIPLKHVIIYDDVRRIGFMRTNNVVDVTDQDSKTASNAEIAREFDRQMKDREQAKVMQPRLI